MQMDEDRHRTDPERLARPAADFTPLGRLLGAGSTSATLEREKAPCEGCGREFLRYPVLPSSRTRRHCDACILEMRRREELEVEAAKAEIREQMRARCGLPWTCRSKTFETWQGTSTAFKAVREWAEEFPFSEPRGYRSLLIYSRASGVGKTHLAAAAANLLIDRWDGDPFIPHTCPVRYETAPSLFERITATYNHGGDGPTTEQVLASLKRVKLLIVDDLLKESEGGWPSPHTQRTYFRIIDHRYGEGLPVLLVSNLDMQELEAQLSSATASRLAEMTRHRVVEVKGVDQR